MAETISQNKIEQALDGYDGPSDDPSRLIELLLLLQRAFDCVPEQSVPMLADRLNLSRADVFGVVSFYHDFKQAPSRAVQVCNAEACQALGSAALLADARTAGVPVAEAFCLGCCATGPNVRINDTVCGRVDLEKIQRLFAASEQVP